MLFIEFAIRNSFSSVYFCFHSYETFIWMAVFRPLNIEIRYVILSSQQSSSFHVVNNISFCEFQLRFIDQLNVILIEKIIDAWIIWELSVQFESKLFLQFKQITSVCKRVCHIFVLLLSQQIYAHIKSFSKIKQSFIQFFFFLEKFKHFIIWNGTMQIW